jgi:hypothetical protein
LNAYADVRRISLPYTHYEKINQWLFEFTSKQQREWDEVEAI